MEKKVAFFDMDGTIVAPCFATEPGDGNYVLGFNKPDWIEYCNKHQESAYNICIPVSFIINFASSLRDEGYDVKILTVTMSPGEQVAKLHWFNNNSIYKSIFSEVIFVPSAEEKVKYVEEYIKSNEVVPNNCTLVEDDIGTVWSSQRLGINALHISHILVGYYGRREIK